jgi:fibronectin-binding autotransporter adhesin
MKTALHTLRVAVTLVAVFLVSHTASAAAKKVSSITLAPPSTNVLANFATNITSTVTVVSGTGPSTRYVGLATLSAYVSPAEPTITATFDPTTFNFPNANSTSNSTLTVSTTALTPSGSYIISVVVDTNPPNATLITPVTNTFTLNVGATFNPQKVWTPAGANTNWSTAGNWTLSGSPTPSNDVLFADLGAVATAGQTNSFVDGILTVGSLTYGQTNNFHTTLIAPGATLTVGGNANGLLTGTGTDPGDFQLTTAAIAGSGATLAVTNKAASINIGQAHSTVNNAVSSAQATLDLSSLDNLNATVSHLFVGVDTAIKGSSGVLNLARTNFISLTPGSSAPQLDVGDNSQAQGTPTIPSVLRLGQTNAIYADSVAVGRGKTDGTGASMVFNNSFNSPTAYFRGTSGNSSRVSTWSIGDGFGSRTYFAFGTCDFSSGTVDALINNLFIGKGADVANGAGANDPGTGTLTFTAGNLDVNTLELGYSTANASGTGTINANGGSLTVNTLLESAHGTGSAGILNISGSIVTANTGVTAGDGAAAINISGGTLNATNSSATIGTSANPLSTFNITNGTLTIPVQSAGPTITTANLAADGTANTVNISKIPLLTTFPAQFPIIQYGLNGGVGSGNLDKFVLGALPPATPPYTAFISNNVASNTIDLVITSGPFVPSLTWDGTLNDNWDTTTANWKPASGPDTAFTQGDFATFDDTLTGTPNVNLATALNPATLTVNNNSTAYVFSGVGKLSGSMALVKSGSGSLTLSESGGDNFTGGIQVNGGTVVLDNANASIGGNTTINSGAVQIGNNDANGSLPVGNVANDGALVFNRADNLTITNAISGAGTLTQSNTNVVTLSGNSSFTGTAVLNRGTLRLGSANGLGTATGVTINSGATFDVNGIPLFGNGNSGLVVTVAGAGVDGNGAIVNNGASASKVLHTVTMTGDTTFGGTGDWDIRNSSGNSTTADAQLNGAFNITKVGTNSISLRGVTVDGGLGNINVQGGTVTFTATASAPVTSLGDPNATVTVNSNATFVVDSIDAVPAKNFVLNNGGTLRSSGTNTISSPLLLTGAANNVISVGTGGQLTITTNVNGPGGLSKNGTATLFLTTNNSYSGSTVVSGGTLALYGNGTDGSISASVNINVTSGAILDVSGRSDTTLSLAGGQTLSGGVGTSGPGVINGILVANLGSTISPGTSATNTGSITITSNATLQGTSLLKLNATAGANDQLSAFAITYGGTLIVTNFSGAITNGQTFQLFVASNGVYTAGSFGSVTLPSAPGLTWTNNLAVNGSITAGATSSQPAQPGITSVQLTRNSLVIGGTNGTVGQQFEVFSSTNLALPLANWTSIYTNKFTSGNFSITNTIDTAVPESFYIIRVP